jgi:hypothetical protein
MIQQAPAPRPATVQWNSVDTVFGCAPLPQRY